MSFLRLAQTKSLPRLSLSSFIRQKSTASPLPSHPTRLPATLHLITGQKFTGLSFGDPKSTFGETVFTTSITSYPESLTDPSYLSQLLVFTTPMIGNYGIPKNSMVEGVPRLESDGMKVQGVIVADLAEEYSGWEAAEGLEAWCKRSGVPGITGIDTREVTTVLREQGTTLGMISVGENHLSPPKKEEFWDPSLDNLVSQVSTTKPYTVNPAGELKIALLDYGAKSNIIRSLVSRGCSVTVFPWNSNILPHMHLFDGLFLSNGPGSPLHLKNSAAIISQLFKEKYSKPIFGICMGNQVIGLAAGLEIERMRFGNRGHNQPVLCTADSGRGGVKKGRVMVTSQNHQYAVKLQDPFPEGWELFFLNANDASVEGIKSTSSSGLKVWGAQFHPEAFGGPHDAMPLFDDYVEEVRICKKETGGGKGWEDGMEVQRL